jgi:hypothetical protein
MSTPARKRYIQLRTAGENPYKAAQIVGITTDDARGRYERAYQESRRGNTSDGGKQVAGVHAQRAAAARRSRYRRKPPGITGTRVQPPGGGQ